MGGMLDTLAGTGIYDQIRVLHVDDEPDFAELAASFIQRENDQFTVDTAISAEEGLNRLTEGEFDCIVSDYQMPGLNGIEFLKAVREEYRDLPFVLFTGRGSEEVASDAISAGVTDYLQKEGGTHQYTVLANRIENAVRKHRAETLMNRAFRAMDSAREGIALLDANGEFIYVNEAYTDIVEYEVDELIGEFWEIVYPESQVTRIYEEILESVPREGKWTGETVYKRKDGSRVLVNHALAYSEEGTMICHVRGLSDTDLDWETLRGERDRFNLFIDAVEEYAIVMLNVDGYITTWNSGAERLTGYTEDEILGDHISSIVTSEERTEDIGVELLQRARTEGSITETGMCGRKETPPFPANFVATAVFDDTDQHHGFGLVIKDITDASRDSPGQ